MNKTTQFRALLKRPGCTVCTGCWDPLSAKLVEQAGFEVAYMSGAAVAASMIGKNDLGYMTQTEVADNVRRITQAIDIPLVADADDGFGNSLNVQRTVR
jgi:2-methylisocitrate lyase-like PEP mutase family enzyme